MHAGEVSVHFIVLLSLFERAQGRVSGEKSRSIDLKYHLNPAVFVLPRVFNATELCAHCNEGLAMHAGKVYVRLIALLRLFERAQGRVSGKK